MVVAKWRQHRDWSNEAALFDLEMDHQATKVDAQYAKIDHACRYALAFRALADESKAIQLFTRYESAHRRSYYKALATLLQLRAQLKQAPEPVQPPAPSDQEPAQAHARTPESELCETNPTSSQDEQTTASKGGQSGSSPDPQTTSCSVPCSPSSLPHSPTAPAPQSPSNPPSQPGGGLES